MKSLEEATTAIQHVNIVRHIIPGDKQFPNNPLLPLLIYQQALQVEDGKIIEDLFESNQWINAWQDGILNVNHYHSTAHEVLAIIQGSAQILFGGPSGIAVSVNTGDVIIIPAGVSHKCLDGDAGFKVVGAYPEGQEHDMNYGKEGERPKTDENIKNVPMPETDPVFGSDGPLIKNWKND